MEAQKALKNLKKVWGATHLLLLAIIVSIPLNAVMASEPHEGLQEMTYDVYAGGFHVVAANLDVDLSKTGRYRLELSAHTRGFLGSLAPWEGTFETHGWYDEKSKNAQPELHKSTTIWRDEPEVKEYLYNRDGSFREFLVTDKHVDQDVRDVSEDLTQETIDALTSTLDVMQAIAEGGKCEGTDEVFDGKRRFKLVFDHQEDVVLEASDYNVYEGPASKCTVEVVPMGGDWHKKPRGWLSIQEQGRDKGTMPTMWMAQIDPDGPAVPVKILVKTDYGALFMHLTGYQNGHEVKFAQNAE